MATDGFILANDLAASMVALTTVKWAQKPGVKSEPLERAWKRLFGGKPGVPVMFTHCKWEGRDVVVRMYPRGRLAVIDPINGASIRVVNWKAVDAASNISSRLQSFDPMTAYRQSHGIADDWNDWSTRVRLTANAGTVHHGRIAGAAHNFLKKTG